MMKLVTNTLAPIVSIVMVGSASGEQSLYHPIFGKGIITIVPGQSDLVDNTLHSLVSVNKDKELSPFQGLPDTKENDGTINCFDDQGNDIGFHCLFETTALTPKNNTLYQHLWHDLCSTKSAGGQIHCHTSSDSSLYRLVMVDHIYRGLVGKADCKCGNPGDFVATCDTTTIEKRRAEKYIKRRADKYIRRRADSYVRRRGDNLGFQPRQGNDRWVINNFGYQFLNEQEQKQQREY
eukprot:Pgem_evm1s4935